MSSGMSLSGLSSGLDTSSIISQLMSIERRPITLMNAKKAKIQSQVDHFRTMSTKMLALQNSAKSLFSTSFAASPFAATSGGTTTTTPGVSTTTVTSSSPATFTATKTGTATDGVYNVNITSLATAQTVGGGATSAHDPGTLTIKDSGGATVATINIPSTGAYATLAAATQGTADAINAVGASPFTASLDGSGNLVLTGKNTGAANNYTLTATTAAGPLASLTLARMGLGTGNVAATNGTATINGTGYTSANNVYAGSLPGMSITGVSTGSGTVTVATTTGAPTTTTVAAGADPQPSLDKIKDFISKYNDIVNQIKDDTSYDATKKTGGVLSGDAFFSNMGAQLNRQITDQFSFAVSAGAGLASYSDAGISVNRDGTLAIDDTKYKAAFAAYGANAMYDLFGNEDGKTQASDALVKANNGGSASAVGDGLARRIWAFTDSMISTSSVYNFRDGSGNRYEGSLLNRISSATKSMSTIDDNVASFDRRMQLREQNLRLQFQAMEKSVASLRSQGNYLSGQFSGLGG